MHELQSKVEDLQRQLEEKRQQVYKLDLEGQRLQGIMQEFQKQELEREEKQESRRILYQNLNEPATWSLTSDRTRNRVRSRWAGTARAAPPRSLLGVVVWPPARDSSSRQALRDPGPAALGSALGSSSGPGGLRGAAVALAWPGSL